MTALPFNRFARSRGGRPNSTHRAFFVWRTWLSRVGMVAWVLARMVLACSTSRSEVVPPENRAWAICRLSVWMRTFSSAMASRFSRVRMRI